MNTLNLRAIAFFVFVIAFNLSQAQTRPFTTDSIASTILGETRELRVITPEDTKDGSKYEVIYVCDGEWYQDLVPNTYAFAASAGFAPKAIFVFMRNRYLNGVNLRDRDFSPVNIGDSLTGGADRFYDFVTKEVAPFIEKKYPSNGLRTLVGSSFSGLFTVYAYLKDPHFFQSFVASDPNLNFGDNHVSHMAAKSIASFDDASGTLYIGGLTNTYRGMGTYMFDSVMRANAPKQLKWKFVAYENETHYSVQLKAFYDAFRFSHFGFGAGSPEFHPRHGIVAQGRSFYVYSLNNNPAVHFTANGSAPSFDSPVMKRDTSIAITAPTAIKIEAFPNRKAYAKSWQAEYAVGKFPANIKAKAIGLSYAYYEGKWDSFPAVKSSATATGKVDSSFRLTTALKNKPGYVVVEGNINVDADAEYIFYTNGYGQIELSIDNKVLLAEKVPGGDPYTSFIASLAKGMHALRLRVLQNAEGAEPHFTTFRATCDNDKWWEKVVNQY